MGAARGVLMSSSPQPNNTPAAANTLQVLRDRYGERYRWYLLLAVMVGAMAAIMSSTIVNVAIPDMSQHFALGQARAQWVSSGFMAAMTVSMLTTPWLLDRYGYRAVYGGAVLLLLAGGVGGGFSDFFWGVLTARLAEGLAAGVLQPIPAIIVLRAFAPHEQGRASGLFGMGVVLAPALGPSLGGVLVDLFGWRSIFFMVVPLCLASLWLAWKFVPSSAPGGALPNRHGGALDWRGLLVASTGTLCLLNGLVYLHGGNAAVAAALLVAAALAITGFIVWQKYLARTGRQPLMNLSLFQSPNFALGSMVALIYGAALFGSTYLLPVLMQRGLLLSASLAGAILLPAGMVLAVTVALVGRLADRKPAYQLVSTGLVLLALSFALMPWVGLQTGLWLLAALAVVGRVGLGFILPSLNLGSMRGLESGLISQGASVINFVRTLGGAAGVSLCGIVLEWRLDARGDTFALAASSPGRLAAFGDTFLMLAALCALATLAAWRIRPPAGHTTSLPPP